MNDPLPETPKRQAFPIKSFTFPAACGSILASGFAIGTGNLWLEALAGVLIGFASLLPTIIDFRATRQALKEARHKAGMAKTSPQLKPDHEFKWPDFSTDTIH